MLQHNIATFYLGAALIFDLDSDEVDHILAEHGLSVEHDTLLECKQALINLYPDRYDDARQRRPYADN